MNKQEAEQLRNLLSEVVINKNPKSLATLWETIDKLENQPSEVDVLVRTIQAAKQYGLEQDFEYTKQIDATYDSILKLINNIRTTEPIKVIPVSKVQDKIAELESDSKGKLKGATPAERLDSLIKRNRLNKDVELLESLLK